MPAGSARLGRHYGQKNGRAQEPPLSTRLSFLLVETYRFSLKYR